MNTPAFPTHSTAFPTANQEGMTLRDYFAAKAMQAMSGNTQIIAVFAEKFSGNEAIATAKAAYEMADAMLKAREQ